MENVDNSPMAKKVTKFYSPHMVEHTLRQRIIDGMAQRGMSKAELSRASGVAYHALDKFLKGKSVTTSAENARALCNALGITMDGEAKYDELRRLFFQLPEEKREFLMASIRGLLSYKDE